MMAARAVFDRSEVPTVLSGQETVNNGRQVVRTYNRKRRDYQVRLLPGGSYVTAARDEVIVTVLGSCVAACVRDPRSGFGGMNHFMLPENETGDWNGISASLRYGNHAMESLINSVLKSGCAREDLEIKLFGGANLYQGVTLVGEKNAEFTRNYLKKEMLVVEAEDLGGPWGRRIHYEPATGRVQRLLLKHKLDATVVRAERKYETDLHRANIDGGIELFD
ncbi:MAG: chemotaxis protein CheD [Roseibium sp.]|uniref:chemoreceptor glutamine deamidase CheD n=1 Tax=Roseibium sp. TaxID=1936156 RepID=UPI001B00D497|nr:chemoreceptor glutamine deamidase CheD [Roseibium sp.]MBO6508958.1 chemotaxis protein CheD [Roseibium sp.]MBO6892655.1 chemotaxis protein CheD [Roseibium sp.]MBO6928215.1 chemotaxis protein CheD [Roseibium sp.]